MQRFDLYRKAQLGLVVLLGLAVLTWWLVRPPKSTSPDAIFGDVERTGRARQLIVDMVRLVRQSATLDLAEPRDELLGRRAQIESIMVSAERLGQELEAADTAWIPVAEATDLLNECRKLGRLALERMPTGNKAAKPAVETLGQQPDLEGMTANSVGVLEESSQQLLHASDELGTRIRKAIVRGMLGRGIVLGMEARDLLLAATILACLGGIALLAYAGHRLSVPVEKAERMEIEMIGRSDRRAAMRRCHARVKELLDMADGFCHRED